MTTKIANHDASSSMDRTCIRWSDINGKSPDSASTLHIAAHKQRVIERKPYSGRDGSTRSDRTAATPCRCSHDAHEEPWE